MPASIRVGSNWPQRPSRSVRAEVTRRQLPGASCLSSGPARHWQACRGSHPERGSKFVSLREPFLQPDVRDLALLLRRFSQFVASSLRSRRRRISSISAADFPVAHTMNTRPNRRSYSAIRVRQGHQRHLSRRSPRSAVPAPTMTPIATMWRMLFVSPIRGCFENASIQSGLPDDSKFRPTPHKEPSSLSGLRCHYARAHASDPQQARSPGPPRRRRAGSRLRALRSCAQLRARGCHRNSATRLPSTADRYAAVDRMSSIGRISATAISAPAEPSSHQLLSLSRCARSSRKRSGVGATLPTAMRMSSTTPPRCAAKPATHTFEIACALRAPTLRE